MADEYKFFVGIDWATEAHQICVLDGDRKVRLEKSIRHSASGFAELVECLVMVPPEQIAVGIEVPRGAIVEGLVERGFHVYSVNPKQLDRFRDRHTVAGAKDDRRDALVLADSLRTDRGAYRRVKLDDPLVVQLRELSRLYDDLETTRVQIANRLREQLHRFYSQILELSPAADEPWLWDLLEAAPTPAHGARLRVATAKRILRSHRIRRFEAEQLVEALRKPPLSLAPGSAEAAREHVEYLLPQLRLANEQKNRCGKRVDELLEELAGDEESESGQKREHRDAEILLSLPGAGRVVGATVLGEASQLLISRDYQSLRALAGTAPVTRQSGKRSVVAMRRACNRSLRNAMHHWARNAAVHDPHFKQLYKRLIERGHYSARAYRTIGDRLLSVLMAMLKDRTLYDPNHPRRVAAPA